MELAGLRIATPREDDVDDDGKVKALSVEELARLIGEVPRAGRGRS